MSAQGPPSSAATDPPDPANPADPPAVAASPPADMAQLRSGIEQTRAELADTLAALMAKINIPRRAKSRADKLTARARRAVDRAGHPSGWFRGGRGGRGGRDAGPPDGG